MRSLLCPSTAMDHFKCQLEYLFFRAGFYSLQPTNINNYFICTNHLNCLMSTEDKNLRCSVCVPIRKRSSAADSDLRRIGKVLAFCIWEAGRPNMSWSVFGNLICPTCRRFFEKNHLNKATTKKSDELFGKYNYSE